MQAQTGATEGDDNNISAREALSDAVEDIVDEEGSQHYSESMPDSEEEGFDTMYQVCLPYRCTSSCKLTCP